MDKPVWFDLQNYEYLKSASLDVWALAIETRLRRDLNPPESSRMAGQQAPKNLALWLYKDSFLSSQKPSHNTMQHHLTFKGPFQRYDLDLLQRCIDELNQYTNQSYQDRLKQYEKKEALFCRNRKFDSDKKSHFEITPEEVLLSSNIDALEEGNLLQVITNEITPNNEDEKELNSWLQHQPDHIKTYIQLAARNSFIEQESTAIRHFKSLSNHYIEYTDTCKLRPILEVDNPDISFLARLATYEKIEKLISDWKPCDTSAQSIFEEEFDKVSRKLKKLNEPDPIDPQAYYNTFYSSWLADTKLESLNHLVDHHYGDNWSKTLVEMLDKDNSILKVNLNTPDGTLIENFAKWLKHKRQSHPLPIRNRGNNPKLTISKSMIHSWIEHKLIPLWDLLFVRHFADTYLPHQQITNQHLADWLELNNYDQPSRAISKKITRLDDLKSFLPAIKAQAYCE